LREAGAVGGLRLEGGGRRKVEVKVEVERVQMREAGPLEV